jgi:hypothetical protein
MQTQAGHRPGHRRIAYPRSGVTWIEVTVVVLILLALTALLLPATRIGRRPARRAECQNNMKQLCTATMSFSAKANGRLPLLTQENEQEIVSNWIVDLLPELDNSMLHQQWISSSSSEKADFEISLKMFQCPKDLRSLQTGGGLSYVANSGYGIFRIDPAENAVYEDYPHDQDSVDWDGDGVASKEDQVRTTATGVFWPRRDGIRFKMRLDYISSGDGQSNTLLFAESLNAGKWNSAKTLDLAFVVGLDRILFENAATDSQCLKLAGANLGPYGIQSRTVPGHTPSPSSNHGGIFIAGFADGGTRQLSVEIDPLVYLRLMTPNGQRYGEAALGPEAY